MQLVLLALRFFRLHRRRQRRAAWHGTAALDGVGLAVPRARRSCSSLAGSSCRCCGAASGWWGGWAGASLSLLLTLGSELLGRYLFFVSVVPRHMAAPYLALEVDAA